MNAAAQVEVEEHALPKYAHKVQEAEVSSSFLKIQIMFPRNHLGMLLSRRIGRVYLNIWQKKSTNYPPK